MQIMQIMRLQTKNLMLFGFAIIAVRRKDAPIIIFLWNEENTRSHKTTLVIL